MQREELKYTFQTIACKNSKQQLQNFEHDIWYPNPTCRKSHRALVETIIDLNQGKGLNTHDFDWPHLQWVLKEIDHKILYQAVSK